MKTCAACRKEVHDDANFCGWCGFRLTPISASDLDTLTRELQPIEEENPILLTKMKKVQGKGERAWRQRLESQGQASAQAAPPRLAPPPRLEVVDEGIAARRVPASQAPIALHSPRATPSQSERNIALAPTLLPADAPPIPVEPPPRSPPVRVPAPVAPATVEARGSGAFPPTASPPPIPADALAPPEPARMPPGLESDELPTVAPPDPQVDHERGCKRFPLKVEVGYASEHNFYTGFMENLSSGGLFVATHNPAELGDVVEVTFSVPALHRNCTAMCLVQWTREYNPSMPDMIPGMGLKFVKLDSDARAAVEIFIKHREPIFYD